MHLLYDLPKDLQDIIVTLATRFNKDTLLQQLPTKLFYDEASYTVISTKILTKPSNSYVTYIKHFEKKLFNNYIYISDFVEHNDNTYIITYNLNWKPTYWIS